MTLDGVATWLSYPEVRHVGWVLVHFLWQGILVAGALAGALTLLRANQAQLRYTLSLAALLVLMALPVATWSLLPVPTPAVASETAASLAALHVPAQELVLAAPPVEQASSWIEEVRAALSEGLPWIVGSWLAGVFVLGLRMLGGWIHTLFIRQAESQPVAASWQQRADTLAKELGAPAGVRVWQSTRIDVPMVIGWLRPVVLMPVSVLTGLPPEQVEALIAHELAHVRRHDVLVGRLQAVVETLLFYHPAVWWVSRQLRIEREHCCDDLVVQTARDRSSYARALTSLAARHLAHPPGAMAATDGSLVARIRRLVLPMPGDDHQSMRSSVSVALLVAAVGLAVTGMRIGVGGEATDKARTVRPKLMPLAQVDTTEQDTTEHHIYIRRSPEGTVIFRDSLIVGDSLWMPPPVPPPAPGVGFALPELDRDSLKPGAPVFSYRARRPFMMRFDTLDVPIPEWVHPIDSLGFQLRAFDDSAMARVRKALDSLHVIWPHAQRLRLDSLDRARMDSLRRQLHQEVRAHRERIRRLTQERREEMARLHREMEVRMREERSERLREQAEHLRRQAGRLEEQARTLEREASESEQQERENENEQ